MTPDEAKAALDRIHKSMTPAEIAANALDMVALMAVEHRAYELACKQIVVGQMQVKQLHSLIVTHHKAVARSKIAELAAQPLVDAPLEDLAAMLARLEERYAR